jgi:predicted transcriptional regulator
MTILRDKGALKVIDDSGRAHVYRASLSRGDAMRDLLDDFAERVFGGATAPLLTQFIEDADLTPEELHDLRAWIDERLEDAEGGDA